MLPFIIISNLDASYKDRWEQQFVAADRHYLESIWRRSEQAVYEGKTDGERRRMIHVIDGYDMVKNSDETYDFAITNCYLWLCTTLPKDEMEAYLTKTKRALNAGGWQRYDDHWKREDLQFSYTLWNTHPEDERAGRVFSENYQTTEFVFKNRNFPETRLRKESPWAVLNSGVRQKGTRTPQPHIVQDVHEILPYLPAQVELGGGASLELGIPPLNYLHMTYNLFDKHDQLAFGENDHLLERILIDPARFYTQDAAVPYKQSLLAEPNNFYLALRQLHDKGFVVGPVITNNFDGICSLIGLEEAYIRRYDEAHIVPDTSFHPKAKSLLVIGTHADRRRIQQAAKAQGLKIIYVDPETYVDHKGNTIPYPLEKVEPDDLLVQEKAGAFAEKLESALTSGKRLEDVAAAKIRL